MKPGDASPTIWTVALVACLLAAVRPVAAAEALTLDDYFAHALARSEVVAVQGELIHQAEERYRQGGPRCARR